MIHHADTMAPGNTRRPHGKQGDRKVITFQPELARLAAQEKHERYLAEARHARMLKELTVQSPNQSQRVVAWLRGRVAAAQQWLTPAPASKRTAKPNDARLERRPA